SGANIGIARADVVRSGDRHSTGLERRFGRFGERMGDMEESYGVVRSDPGSNESRTPAAWRDLRQWIELVEQHGNVHRIAARVDPDEELSAITYMRTQDETAPAILFENLPDNPLGA